MKITVLMGGTSAERDVSVQTGVLVAEALRGNGHSVTVIDTARGVISEERESHLRSQGIAKTLSAVPNAIDLLKLEGDNDSLLHSPALLNADCIFLALHGPPGEDGKIQAVLDMLGLPYTGSGMVGSAVAMDKELSKCLFRAHDIPTPDWAMAPVDAADVERSLGWPVVVKPSKQGSTVGLTIVREASGLASAITEALRWDDEVLVEAFVPGRELTVGVLGESALPVGEIIPRNEIFDYEAKYQPGMSEEIFPADIPESIAVEAQRLALMAHRALKLDGYSRADFRLTAGGELFCLEVNTLPGMTRASLFPQAVRAAGKSFEDALEAIVAAAMSRHHARRNSQ